MKLEFVQALDADCFNLFVHVATGTVAACTTVNEDTDKVAVRPTVNTRLV